MEVIHMDWMGAVARWFLVCCKGWRFVVFVWVAVEPFEIITQAEQFTLTRMTYILCGLKQSCLEGQKAICFVWSWKAGHRGLEPAAIVAGLEPVLLASGLLTAKSTDCLLCFPGIWQRLLMQKATGTNEEVAALSAEWPVEWNRWDYQRIDEDYLFIRTGYKIPVMMGGENMMGGGRWAAHKSKPQVYYVTAHSSPELILGQMADFQGSGLSADASEQHISLL